MISKDTIERVFSTLQIEEVIGDFVQLKRSGANYKGLSPFSDETFFYGISCQRHLERLFFW